jgi:hypothetical protein
MEALTVLRRIRGTLDTTTLGGKVDAHRCTAKTRERVMALQFIGIEPETGKNGSPTAWVDQESADIVLQSYTADDATRAQCIRTPAPGHAPGIPGHETVIRIPARMIPVLREACDAAEAQL